MEPASDFVVLLVFLERSALLAILATFGLVCFLAIFVLLTVGVLVMPEGCFANATLRLSL